ncbi:AAA family ATPase [Roseomonas genomospecies 6]|uniref:Exonuclease n=1 Tax=Roseomonas genomospecies 6 TaxID=214106 RepID=A0A9W7KP53_9PROT|nr:AAA family ATPase [Roseomonas genomospecies 6]KAA0676066.1 exonuclease [Roseomonas genomospecies 6]
MRILAVRGCNLASLDGTFAVELGDGPLRHAGLFAITGPTGAGKSTILDALCLALFDRMPRLPDGRGVTLGASGDTDAISTTDVRSVLRRGAGSGWAEVDFLGIDGGAYRARWELRRARQNARGALQKQTMSLTALSDGKRLGDGKTSVLEEISTRLGLSFEQFRRAVLLAQGDFANFLKAPATERSALLELLTGTEIYSRISIAAFERSKEEQRALEALEAQCAGIGVLSDEARAALDAEAATAVEAVRREEAVLESARAAVAWHEQDARLAAAEADAEAKSREAERVWQEAGPRRDEAALLRKLQPLRARLSEADRCAAAASEALEALDRARTAVAEAQDRLVQADARHKEVRGAYEAARTAVEEAEPELERAAALDAEVATLTDQQAGAFAEAATAEAEVRALRESGAATRTALEQALADAAERERWLAGQTALVPVADQWARWDALLIRHRDSSRVERDAAKEAGRAAQEAAAHEAELVRLSTLREEATARRDEAERTLAALKAEPVEPLDALRGRRTALAERRDGLSALAQVAERAKRLAADAGEAEAERVRQRVAAEEGDARAMETRARLDQRRAALEEADAALHRLRLARGEDAASLRAQLVEGDACPVCGATEHPWGAWGTGHTPLDRLADDQNRRVAALRAEVTELATEHGAQAAAAKAARERAAVLDKRLAALSAERVEAAERWAERAAAFGLPTKPDAEAVSRRLADVDAELAEAGKAEAAALDHRARLDKAVQACREREAALADTERASEARARQRDSARHTESLAAARRDQGADARAAVQAELAQSFAGLEGWSAALERDPDGFREAIAARVADVLRQRDGLAQARRDVETLERQAGAKAAELEGARQAEQAARRRCEGLAATVEERRTARAALLGGRAVSAVKKELTAACQRAEALVEQATVARQDAAARLSAAEQNVATRGDSARRCTAEAETAVDALAAAAERCGVTVDDARAHLVRDEDWLTGEERALAALDSARRDNALLAAERTRLRREHHGAGLPSIGAEEARAAVAEAAGRLQDTRGRLGEVQARLRADMENRIRLAAVIDRVEAQRRTHGLWASMAQLIGSADGRKLRNFAQSLSLDLLLVQANRYLADLARRYRLERVGGADLEIQVVDGEMGDERRGVHSLSGGEMFLVSLALALGLSAMAGGSGGGIGTLFIDEGFGTLDPGSLDLALSCLEALQATGRQVGVISHVPALVERIGVQVRVTPLGGGRSAVTVTRGALAVPDAAVERELLLSL